LSAWQWLAYWYFGALTVLCWTRPLPIGRRIRVTAIGFLTCMAVLWVRRRGASIADIAPLVLILIGYYLSGLYFIRPTERFEAWLEGWDRRLLGDPTTRFAQWPRAWLAFLDIIYVGCFLLVPAGAVALLAGRHALFLDRYWTMVMGAEFGAFLPLTIVQARPPWAIEREPALRDRAGVPNAAAALGWPAVHRMAARFVREVTIRANTFPSGHAAGSLAVALAVIGVRPLVGFVLLVLALCICLACIVGRYHYVMDVVTGIALALVIYIAVVSFGL
jgi:membrane-associated phospholipid phosphatase